MPIDEEEIAKIILMLDTRIKYETENLRELMRLFQNLKGITLVQGDMPKISGQIPMSESMREEILQAVRTGCLTHGISLNT